MNFQKALCISIGVLISTDVLAVESLKIQSQGWEGHKHFYNVVCPNGKRSSLTVIYDNPEAFKVEIKDGIHIDEPKVAQICTIPHSGTEKCDGNWNIDQAAKASCP